MYVEMSKQMDKGVIKQASQQPEEQCRTGLVWVNGLKAA